MTINAKKILEAGDEIYSREQALSFEITLNQYTYYTEPHFHCQFSNARKNIHHSIESDFQQLLSNTEPTNTDVTDDRDNLV